MFRQGMRRCGALARLAPTPSILAVSRSGLPVAKQTVASLSRPVAPVKSFANFVRLYSREATAVDDRSAAAQSSDEVAYFKDLAQAGVHPNLLRAITDDMGYDKMTPVQAKTIQPALKGTDIVAQAKTGTGKTIAFLLPLFQRMIEEDPTLATRSAMRHARSDDIRGIVLTPTRELAEQIATEARRLVRNTGLVVQSAVGGTHKASMLRQTQRQGCHLLVATPGRLNDLLQDPNSGIDAPKLAAAVLDEADRMLDVGFENELKDIQRALPSAAEKVRQTILVSATIPDNVIRLARTMVRPHNFQFVQTIAENESLTHERIPQNVVPVQSWANIFPAISELLEREVAASREDPSLPPVKAIIYFNTTSLVQFADQLGYLMRKNGTMRLPTFSIQSKLTQNARTRAAELFRNARSGVLYSSDVTARGMDFPDVTHVIQVDCPRDRESYIHRLGRTGRQGKGGQGWLFIPPSSADTARRMLRGLPLKPNTTLETPDVDLTTQNDLPKYHEQVQALTRGLPPQMLRDAYTSIFGCVVDHKSELVDDLNLWYTKGFGLEEPPAVSSKWAANLGMSNTSLNIRDGVRFDRSDRFDRGGRDGRDGRDGRGGRGGFGDRRGGRDDGGRGGSRFGSRNRSVDAFAEMGRNARRDTGKSRGHGRSSW